MYKHFGDAKIHFYKITFYKIHRSILIPSYLSLFLYRFSYFPSFHLFLSRSFPFFALFQNTKMLKPKQIKFSLPTVPESKSPPESERKQRANPLSDWVPADMGECLDRMFDPLDFSHLPIDEQLRKFKQRDLRESKLFKTAQAVYGKVPIRKRRYNAEHLVEVERERAPDASVAHLREETPFMPPTKLATQPTPGQLPTRIGKPTSPEKQTLAELEKSYQGRLQARMQLRSNLDTMGNLTNWVMNKPAADRTPLEQSYLRKWLDERRKQKVHIEEGPQTVQLPTVCALLLVAYYISQVHPYFS